MSRHRRTFTPKFKLQLVKLYENGITPSALDHWIKNHRQTVSFAAKDNQSEEENEMARLRKENQRLLMENDILKQVALIMGRK